MNKIYIRVLTEVHNELIFIVVLNEESNAGTSNFKQV